MNILEATKLALEQNAYITRKTEAFKPFILLPTNTDDCFVVHVSEGYEKKINSDILGKRWNPKAEDILANDWEVKSNL